MPERNKRRGLQKLECPGCPGVAWMTWSMAEQLHAAGGLPVCQCGARYEPTDYELGLALGLDDCAAVAHFSRVVNSIAYGQTPHAMSDLEERRRAAKGRQLESPALLAHARVEAERRDAARAARLRAIAPAPEPIPF